MLMVIFFTLNTIFIEENDAYINEVDIDPLFFRALWA